MEAIKTGQIDDDLTKAAEASEDTIHKEKRDGISGFLVKMLGKDVDSMRMSIPMWLLEPVSSLVWVADFGRVEDFVAAPLAKGIDRMLAICRLFFSGLAQMWSRSTCKKPLNPILGETVLYNYTGPGPSAFLVGEQVSHHPPVSAYYLACPERRISALNNFSMSAKFNGMSFSLINNSRVFVTVDGETYTVQYPDAVVAGMLVMRPRFLWRGTSIIECAETNCRAEIHFKDQKFIGKDTFQVSGTISGVEQTMTLSGEWNKTVLVDGQVLFCTDTPTEYTAELDPSSSTGRTWEHVISAMNANESNTAKKLKNQIENEQRELEKTRCAMNQPFIPQFFAFEPTTPTKDSQNNGVWRYIGPNKC